MAADAGPRFRMIVREIASSEGYGLADAGFIRTKELSIRWRLSSRDLSLYVSDYLEDAPDIILRQYVSGCLSHILGRKTVFEREYMDYMNSDRFLLAKRPVYVARARNLLMNDVGRCHTLFDSVQRLLDDGLLGPSDIENTVFTWTASPNYNRLGYCSQLMRVVTVSSALDDERVPERILDYVVYHECLHLRQRYRPLNRHPHDAAFRREMARFQNAEDAKREFDRLTAELKRTARKRARSRQESSRSFSSFLF